MTDSLIVTPYDPRWVEMFDDWRPGIRVGCDD